MPMLSSGRNGGFMHRRRYFTSGGVTVAVSDTFARTAATLGAADTGQVWTAHVGTFGTNGTQALESVATDNGIATVDSGVSDCTVTLGLPVAAVGSSGAGIAFRLSDASNYWRACYDFNSGTISLQRIAAGNPQVKDLSVSHAIADGDVLSVVLSGTSITLKLNGATLGSVTHAFNQTATRHGIAVESSSTSLRWDNFTVTVP